MNTERTYAAFAGDACVAAGSLATVLLAAKRRHDRDAGQLVLLFEDDTGRQVDFDLRGTPEEVVARATTPVPAGPGRPRLGVVAREVTLLPRHWEWLESQPSGISAALRRLVDEARKRDPEGERARMAIDATSRVMTALAGNRPGFEEASRALFARDGARFDALVRRWPKDVRAQLRRLAGPALPAAPGAGRARKATVETRSRRTRR